MSGDNSLASCTLVPLTTTYTKVVDTNSKRRAILFGCHIGSSGIQLALNDPNFGTWGIGIDDTGSSYLKLERSEWGGAVTGSWYARAVAGTISSLTVIEVLDD